MNGHENEGVKFSIITVCLNTAATIAATFESVLAQTYKNYEIIVIDGGSSDGTVDIIRRYGDRISAWVSEPDTGIYNAMNKGIARANGDLLFFLNANDVFCDSEVLEKVAGAAGRYPERKFLFGDLFLVAPDRSSVKLKKQDNVADKAFFFNYTVFHQSIFYRRELFAEIGLYCEEFKIVSDWEFNIRCLCEHHVPALYLGFPVANFLEGGLSGNRAFRKTHLAEREVVLHKYFGSGMVYWGLKTATVCRKLFNSIYKHVANTALYQKIGRRYRDGNQVDVVSY